ncbi:MAG TPA: hypothetical protein VNT42_11540 [Sphingomonas sp.]|nr:hypothetical protein [Sphingomonas sp.]
MAFKSLRPRIAALIVAAMLLPTATGAQSRRTPHDPATQAGHHAYGDHGRDRYGRDGRDDYARDGEDPRRVRRADPREEQCRRDSGTLLSAVAGGLLGSNAVAGRRGNHLAADHDC